MPSSLLAALRRPRFVALACALVVAAGATVAASVLPAGAGAQTPPPTVAAFPSPGSVDASPTTQISIRGLPLGRIGNVTVRGSRTGTHSGHWRAHSDGQGASFLPARAFSPGETVTVTTGLNVDGAQGSTYSFAIGRPVALHIPYFGEVAQRRAEDVVRYRSRHDLAIPRLSVLTSKPGLAPGYVFLAPKIGPGQDGPEIADDRGQPVWFHALRAPLQALDFREQRYHGNPVLTWWQGPVQMIGTGQGEGRIVDSRYRTIGRVIGGNGYHPDLHEFLISRESTALVTSVSAVHWNLSSVGGPRDGIVLDSIVQEIDIPTGLVLFEWHSLGHVPLSDCYFGVPKGQPWDYFHINSVDEAPDGSLLVGARDTSAAYLIDRRTGAIQWTLGGKHSTFALGAGARFWFQHDVRLQPDGTVTMFDDEGSPRKAAQSRALQLRPDLATKTVTVVGQLHRGLGSANQGNAQWLPDGHIFVGWGNHSVLSEFDQAGRLLWDARMPPVDQSYRAYRFTWTGTPTAPPAIAAGRHRGGLTVWASWNGATEVDGWRVLGGSHSNALRRVAGGRRTGFETAIGSPAERFVAVQALDRAGHVLGTSKTIRTG